jgi:hypothetical protein
VNSGDFRMSATKAESRRASWGFSSSKATAETALGPRKFEALMSYQAVDFQENLECFEGHTKRLKELLEVRQNEDPLLKSFRDWTTSRSWSERAAYIVALV